jgi:hypothetical protein
LVDGIRDKRGSNSSTVQHAWGDCCQCKNHRMPAAAGTCHRVSCGAPFVQDSCAAGTTKL